LFSVTEGEDDRGFVLLCDSAEISNAECFSAASFIAGGGVGGNGNGDLMLLSDSLQQPDPEWPSGGDRCFVDSCAASRGDAGSDEEGDCRHVAACKSAVR
jgi:hypothetical protein